MVGEFLTGRMPIVIPMFIIVCIAISVVIPIAIIIPSYSLAKVTIFIP